jgi:hypothetical protein
LSILYETLEQYLSLYESNLPTNTSKVIDASQVRGKEALWLKGKFDLPLESTQKEKRPKKINLKEVFAHVRSIFTAPRQEPKNGVYLAKEQQKLPSQGIIFRRY